MSNYIYLIILISVLFISCNETLEVDTPDFNEKLVVESYVCNRANSLSLKLSKTFSPYEFMDYTSTALQIHEAKVVVYINGTGFLMKEDTTKYKYYEDGSQILITRRTGEYYLDNVTFSSAKGCNIEITAGELSASANSKFPDFVKLEKVDLYIENLKKENYAFDSNIIHLKIKADYPQDIKSYYRVVFVTDCHKFYDLDYYYHLEKCDYFIHSSSSSEEEIVMDLQQYVIDSGRRNTKIFLDHISKDYYDFVKTMETQENNDGGIFGSEGTQIPSNIKNGFGIFTCFTRDTICID